MPSSALPQLKDWLLIRHSSSRKHGDFSSVESQIEMPFESGSTSSSSSGFSEWTRPGDRWVVVGQLPKRSWAAVYSNQENEDLFEHFCKRRRLEVLWIKSQPDGFSIKIVKEKRETLNWGSVNDGVVTAKCSDDKLLVLLNGCKGRDDVLKVVCSNFEVPRKMPDVIEQDGEFQLIGTSGRPVKTGMKNLVLFNGSGLAEGENDASELLSDAIDSCDIDKLKQAIEMGADAEDVALTVHAHPTLNESIGLAAEIFEGSITDMQNKKAKKK